ncbi:hypothetical protein HKX48_003528 [Thoreauomyces humboldtii]|nr:hypothetical protein HKX48_003528 [Thoreauomyces humboldtii]
MSLSTLLVEIRDAIIKFLEWKDVWRLRSVSRSLRRQCLDDNLIGYALLNSRGPYNFECKHDMAAKGPALVLFDNYDYVVGGQRQWMAPSAYDPVREAVTFVPVAVTIGACKSCNKGTRAGAYLSEHERAALTAGTKVSLSCRNYGDRSSSVSARFEAWYPIGTVELEHDLHSLEAAYLMNKKRKKEERRKEPVVRFSGIDHEYSCTPISVENFTSTSENSDSENSDAEEDPYSLTIYNVLSLTVSISWILQGISSSYVEPRGLRPRLLRRLAEKLDNADLPQRQLFENASRSSYGQKWVRHEKLFYWGIGNAPQGWGRTTDYYAPMVITAEARTADALLREKRVKEQLNGAIGEDLEWWLYENYFNPYGLNFDGKTVPPIEKIPAASAVVDLPAPTSAFEFFFKKGFEPVMKYLDRPGSLFKCSKFLQAIGNLDAKAAWMSHRVHGL